MFNIRKDQENTMFQAIKTVSDEATAAAIVFGENGKSIDEDDAAWVKSAMTRLEKRFDPSAVKKIRMGCQCGYAMDEKVTLVKDLMKNVSSMEEFANQSKARDAGLSCKDGALYLQFPFCPCPMLANVDRLETNTWCQCTTGYSKVLFEKVFNCTVDVELLKSVKMGDDICLMKIIPHESIFPFQNV